MMERPWREASHATPSASTAATTSLSGRFDGSVQTSGCSRCVTESSLIAVLPTPGLHLTLRRVAGDNRVMLPGDLMLRAGDFAGYGLRRHGQCGGDQSGGRKCDDRCLHFSVLPPWNRKAHSGAKLDLFHERAASRYSEGEHFVLMIFRDGPSERIVLNGQPT